MRKLTLPEIEHYLSITNTIANELTLYRWENALTNSWPIKSKLNILLVSKILKEIGVNFKDKKLGVISKKDIKYETCGDYTWEFADQIVDIVFDIYNNHGWEVRHYDIESEISSIVFDIWGNHLDIIEEKQVTTIISKLKERLPQLLNNDVELFSSMLIKAAKLYKEGMYLSDLYVLHNKKYGLFLRACLKDNALARSSIANKLAYIIDRINKPLNLYLRDYTISQLYKDEYVSSFIHWYETTSQGECLDGSQWQVERALYIVLFDQLLDIAIEQYSIDTTSLESECEAS